MIERIRVWLGRKPPSSSPRSTKVFVSYRREDSAGYTGWLCEQLNRRLPDPVFKDLDTLVPGEDFPKAIQQALSSCEVFLAVIGPHWLTLTDAAGRRRLDDAGDYVRQEIATALKQDGLTIPILVHRASMPKAEDLPKDLAKLSTVNAIELTNASWTHDVDRLIEAIGTRTDVLPKGPTRLARWVNALRNVIGFGVASAPLLLASLVPYPISRIVPFSIVAVALGFLAAAVRSHLVERVSPLVVKWCLGLFSIAVLIGFVWIFVLRDRFTIQVPNRSTFVDVLVGPSPTDRLPDCPCPRGEDWNAEECIRRFFRPSTVKRCWGQRTAERLRFEGAYLLLTCGWGGLIGLTWFRRGRTRAPEPA